MKTCNKCGSDRPLSQYTADKRNKDGLQGICLVCKKAATQAKRALRMQGVGITPVQEKTCNLCGKTKPSGDFYRDSGFSDGRASQCKACKHKSTYKWRAKKREEYNEYMRQYRRRHPAKYEQERGRSLKNRYGVTLDKYNEMLSAQNGVCAICSNPPAADRPLYVDHHHDTGKVRQLLCASCNRSIAILDNDGLLVKAMKYIKKHKD